MTETTRLNTVLIGICGEYYVAAELSRRGYIASMTLRNTKGIDILVSNEVANRSVGIQVKTSFSNQTTWILHKKVECFFAENLFYIFCNINNDDPPSFYVVPSKVVATFSQEYHAKWMSTPGKVGQKHNDTTMRKFIDKERKYLNRWDLLNL